MMPFVCYFDKISFYHKQSHCRLRLKFSNVVMVSAKCNSQLCECLIENLHSESCASEWTVQLKMGVTVQMTSFLAEDQLECTSGTLVT